MLRRQSEEWSMVDLNLVLALGSGILLGQTFAFEDTSLRELQKARRCAGLDSKESACFLDTF